MNPPITFIGFAVLALILFAFLYIKISGREYPKNLFYIIQEPADIAKLFPQTTRELTKRVNDAMADAQKQINAIIAIPDDQRTFTNTLQAFDAIGSRSDLTILANSLRMINMLNPDMAMREKAQTLLEEIMKFITEQLEHNTILYRAIKSYVQNRTASENLSGIQRYYIDELMKQFKRNGLELAEEQQEKIRNLKNEITKIELQFETNISNDAGKTIKVSRKNLEGLPDDYIDSFKKADDGDYLVGVDYATVDRVMTLCSVSSTRQKLWETFNNRAYPANDQLLKSLITKRQQLASLLGYPNYATFNIDDTMAATPKTVEEFLADNIGKVEPKELQEFRLITKDLPNGIRLAPGNKIYPWDFAYLQEQYKRTHLNLDEQKIAEYFPMEKTIDGLMKVYGTFFNLELEKLPVTNLWYNNLSVLQITDRETKKLIGYLILDLFPRAGKFSHACHSSIISALKVQGQEDRPWVGAIIANFQPSTAKKPSLLKRNEVQTFFHELGHAMHSMLGRQEIGQFAGTSVKFDFVEVPSMMFEEWLYDPEVLRLVSSHYQTGDPLPDEIIKKIIAAKSLFKGTFVQRQGFQSMLSLRYYQNEVENPLELYQRLYSSICPHLALSPADHKYASFGHLTDYGARYYTYLWSIVIALDLAGEIKKEGFLNPSNGKRLREMILAQGGSQDPKVLVHNFLGRDFNNKAFLQDIGIKP